MSERFKADVIEGARPVLYIVCSHGHKLRRIAKIVSAPKWDVATATYRHGIDVIYVDRRTRDAMEAVRLYAHPTDVAPSMPGVPTTLHAAPHLTYTFPCGALGCPPVAIKEEGIERLYAAYAAAGRGACELDALAATINR